MATWDALVRVSLLSVFLLIIFRWQIGNAVHVPGETVWSYFGETGPKHWCKLVAYCCGLRQSPITLDEESAISIRTQNLNFHHYTKIPANMTLDNNGHTVDVRIASGDVLPTISGGGLLNSYTFNSLHFHWGRKNNRGSEHILNYKRYPIELHIVHVKSKFNGDINTAKHSNESDAIAVLAVLFELSNVDNKDLKPIFDQVHEVSFEDDVVVLKKTFPLIQLLPKNKHHFYRYHGSLTTPDCNQVVSWTVFKSTSKISKHQLEILRELLPTERNNTFVDQKLSDNWRPIQSRFNRAVYLIETDNYIL